MIWLDKHIKYLALSILIFPVIFSMFSTWFLLNPITVFEKALTLVLTLIIGGIVFSIEILIIEVISKI